MPNYPGKTKGTRRVIVSVSGTKVERIVRGTKRDGDAFEARLRLELEADGLSKRVAPTWLDFSVHQYRPYAETNLRESTWKKVRIYQVATLSEFFGAMKLTGISTDEVETYKRVRLRAQTRASTINNELRVLGTVLRYARELGYPCAKPKIRKLPLPAPRVHVWTFVELERLFAEARKERGNLMRILVYLANTGCRKGEAIATEWDWIDFDAGMIRIPSNEHWRPKNGKPREVPISDACRAVLLGEREDKRWVFPRHNGEGRYTDFPKDAFWVARDRAKLSGGPHTLRHTFASHFLAGCPELKLLAEVLGHSHTRVTELYAHLLPGHLERARNVVNIGPSLKVLPNGGSTVGSGSKS